MSDPVLINWTYHEHERTSFLCTEMAHFGQVRLLSTLISSHGDNEQSAAHKLPVAPRRPAAAAVADVFSTEVVLSNPEGTVAQGVARKRRCKDAQIVITRVS
ncbi:hypothetical protein PBY51_000490 [Eleginops maclovinus]|uniref:Uncharacterized protein n=1 Tax=Eleginops maclovinus TaxID=56733 RepID=A0AAN7XFP5_ELEMC|nr:hypothetical protein PBY51_000490 [Eleginops maclovinus]